MTESRNIKIIESFDKQTTLIGVKNIIDTINQDIKKYRDIAFDLIEAELYTHALLLFDRALRITSEPVFLHRHIHTDISELLSSEYTKNDPFRKILQEKAVPVNLVYGLNENTPLYNEEVDLSRTELHRRLGRLEKINGIFHTSINCPYDRL